MKTMTEDTKTCREPLCQNKPQYRLLTMGKEPENGAFHDGIFWVSMLCQECMTDELNEFRTANARLHEPLNSEFRRTGDKCYFEDDGGYLPRNYGLVIVPIDLSKKDLRSLIKELKRPLSKKDLARCQDLGGLSSE